MVTGMIAVGPEASDELGKIGIRLLDTSGETIAEHEANLIAP